MDMHRKTQSGSVMVWILVAVMLFAALSFVVSENMRGGSPEVMSTELAKNHATEILQFASSVRRAVQALKIDGVADTEISFENSIVSGYDNTNCTSASCRVFSPSGGGINYVTPGHDWLAPVNAPPDHHGAVLFTGNTCIAFVGSGGTNCESDGDTGSEELLLIVPYIKRNICVELNKKLGFNLPSGEPLQEGASAWHTNPVNARFTGTFINNAEIGDGNNAFQRTRSGCFEGTGTPAAGTYHFYEVLLAR